MTPQSLVAAPANPAEEIKIVSYNIQSGCSAPMNEGTFGLKETTDYLKSLNADVIILQEVGYSKKGICKGTGSDMTGTMASALNMNSYAYGTLSLLTKFTIIEKTGKKYSEQHPGSSRKYMRVKVKTPSGNEFVVFNTHLERGYTGDHAAGIAVRKKQIEELKNLVTQELANNAILLGGDFNECDTSLISTTFSNFWNAISGNTFTPKKPTDDSVVKKLALSSSCNNGTANSPDPKINEQIDYLLADKKNWMTIDDTVLTSAEEKSDHYPVQATFKLSKSVGGKTPNLVVKNGAKIYSYKSSCSGSMNATQEIIIDDASSSFNKIYFNIHGTDGAGGAGYCDSIYKLCKQADTYPNTIFAGLRTKGSAWTNLRDINFSCLYNETASTIQNIPEISGMPSDTILAGFSAGGYALKSIYSKQQIPSGVNIVHTLFFDSCFDSNCSVVAKLPSSKRGVMWMYSSPKVGTNGAVKDKAANAAKTSTDNIHHIHIPGIGHNAVFNTCFKDHIIQDKCGNKGTLMSSSGSTQGSTTGQVNTASVTVNTSVPFLNQIELLLKKPQPRIHIPGLSFSDLDISKLLTQEGGSTWLNLPFIGEYIAAIYKYSVIVVSIIGVFGLMIGGIMWMMSGGTADGKQRAIKYIKNSIIGIVLTVTSYALLFLINPNLVNFQSLKILYVKGDPLAGETTEEATGNPSTNFSALNTSTKIAGKIGSTSEVTKDYFLKTQINDKTSDGWAIWSAMSETEKSEALPYMFKKIADACPGMENWVKISGVPGWNGKFIHKDTLAPFKKAHAYAQELGFSFVMGSTVRNTTKLVTLWNTGIVARYKQGVNGWKSNQGIISKPSCKSPHSTGGAVDINLKSNKTGKIVLGAGGGKITKANYEQKFFGMNTTNAKWKKLAPYRVLLEHIMNHAGFVRLCTEHWHFSYGVTVRYANWQKNGGNTRCWGYTDSYDKPIPESLKQKVNALTGRTTLP